MTTTNFSYGSDTSRCVCPLCKGELCRTWRRPVDRFASVFVPLQRYRCGNFSCQWEGNFRTPARPATADALTAAMPVGPRPVSSGLPGFITSASAFVAVLVGILIASQWTNGTTWAGAVFAVDESVSAVNLTPTALGKEIPVGPRSGSGMKMLTP